MSTDDSLGWFLGLFGTAIGGVLVAAAIKGASPSSGGVNAAWTRDIFPAWRTSWIRERPEFYAELVSRIANPELSLEERDPSRMSANVKRSDAAYAINRPWFATKDLYAAMEDVRANLVSFLYMPTCSVPGQAGEVSAYTAVHTYIKNGNPRSVLTDEERSALREFMEAALAYTRIHKAAVHEIESGTEIGDLFAGAMVSVDDVARVLGRHRDEVREKLVAGLTDQIARFRQLKDDRAEQRLADTYRVRDRLAQTGNIPFAYVKSFLR